MGKRELDEINDGWDEEMINDGYQYLQLSALQDIGIKK